jgi:NSS family neurotransmitter:Na+ symporter
MIGVAVGLGNVWRFPYMVGRFGGAAFVVFYVAGAILVGVPALMAEWALGRHTRRGPVGAFEKAGVPGGRLLGWTFFVTVTAATAYYTDAIGWVVYHGLAQAAGLVGVGVDASAILPPERGLDGRSLGLQLTCSAAVIVACAAVLLRGLRRGIERVSRVVTPLLFVILAILILRSLTLPGAGAGLRWYILKFDPGSFTGSVAVAALGQVVFSLALGGTFMVIYGSYLGEDEALGPNALWTVVGDTGAGLLAGLAVFPAVFAFGLEPGGGPGLIFATLPEIFGRLPAGGLFGALFFLALAAAAFLSDVAAFEALVAGLTDNTRIPRKRAVWLVAAAVLVLAVPPMLNMRVFVPWDLTFGSGAQTVGALAAAATVGWALARGPVLKELAADGSTGFPLFLYFWIRFAIPGAILAVGVWWALTDVLGAIPAV